MSTFDHLLSELNNTNESSVKNFGKFKILKVLGRGQQGIVLKIINNIDKTFALKFYQPTDTSPSILMDSISKFINEVNTLANLNHKNIVNIYTGGHAILESGNWSITEGFPTIPPSNLGENEFYFYIMDYIEGYDLTYIFPELVNESIHATNLKLSRVEYFELLVKQVSKAMFYYHNKGITHKDIKPQNIRFSTEDDTFIIVDFGFAHHTSSPQNDEVIPRVDYIDLPSIENNDYKKNDMGQFNKMLMKILPHVQKEYSLTQFKGINEAIEKGKNPILDKRFINMQTYYTDISQYFVIEGKWKFQLKLDEYLTSERFGRFNSKVRIPISGSVLLFNEIKEIIDSPEFQRLRGVRQLGPTIFIFPGANHTRFEHSIGSYFLSLKYLEQLLSLSTFRNLCDSVDQTIKVTVLAALLHDIGHYPYSHWVEEIDEFPNKLKLPSHEQRATEIIKSSVIGEIIESKWNVSVSTISTIINNNSTDELLNSILSSIIDIDKLDYLRRDSVHCGISYGSGIDLERLLDSLYVDEASNKITVTEKGRSALISILTTRNIMYQEVYWHKTVRACEAMFKRFLYEYVSSEHKSHDTQENKTLNDLLSRSDDEFISFLYQWAVDFGNNKIIELIKPFAYGGRKYIYKPAYIYYSHDSKVSTKINNFFRHLFKYPNNKYSNMILISEKFCKALKRYIPSIEPLDLIFEVTPVKGEGEEYMLDGLRIYNTRKEEYNKYPDEMNLLNSYLSNNRQAYIFCNPKYYDELHSLFQDKKRILQDILGEL